MRQTVDVGAQLVVGPAPAVGGAEHRPVAGLPGEQFGGAVEPFGVLQLRQVEAELGPLFRWREVVAGEGVDVRGGSWIHDDSPPRRGGLAGKERIVLVTAVNGPR
ncbi:hypothetical protein GCM10009535_09690 [Streptomyces thermocarboxydovorans]|uniref:Uncharacterized protein n=1 Tax=Streptomyces thermocarboxydovorans TaxID=59298 RepID=A0ABN1HAI8_9ACTN